jgi:hypothetical protein
MHHILPFLKRILRLGLPIPLAEISEGHFFEKNHCFKYKKIRKLEKRKPPD